MEAIVPAFLLALLSQATDKPALLAAILADRYRRPVLTALAATLAHGVGNGLAALAGAMVAAQLTPEARSLMLAIALVFAGVAGLVPARAGVRFDRWPLGALFAPLIGIFIVALGDRTQFFTFALAARSMPWLAAIGATLGAGAVAFVAAVLGESTWRGLPLKWVRLGSGVLFLVAGSWIALGALRLA